MSLVSGKFNTFNACKNVYGGILVGFSFLLLTLITVKTFAPEVKSEAANQTASQTVGPYTMSMSNDSVATVNITPTNTQTVYTATNNLSVTNTCSAGATITMTTNSTTSNSLTRSATNSDTLTKDIAATTTTSLDDNSWGYALNDSSTYYAVPKKGTTAATIYNEAVARTSAYTVPIKFGVKTDNNMPSGTYTNDVVYTMLPKSGCNSYSVTWNYDGGTAKSGATYPTSLSWGQTVNLSTLTPTKSGYTFAGWTSGEGDNATEFTGTETNADINPNNLTPLTIQAKWKQNCLTNCTEIDVNINESIGFDYTGAAKETRLMKDGYYKLEVWGAQGGGINSTSDNRGGLGGYSRGTINSSKDTIMYIYVGGAGVYSTNGTAAAGFNGGGYAAGGTTSESSASGGGGSDIRITTDSLYSRVIVAGGGGGSGGCNSGWARGGYGGGTTGGTGGHTATSQQEYTSATGGTQTSGGRPSSAGKSDKTGDEAGSFGKGGDITTQGGGGGGGWYGGGSYGHRWGSGGGSGYVYTSSTASNYPSGRLLNDSHYLINAETIAGNASMPNPRGSGNITGNTGNGYAKITYLGTSI